MGLSEGLADVCRAHWDLWEVASHEARSSSRCSKEREVGTGCQSGLDHQLQPFSAPANPAWTLQDLSPDLLNPSSFSHASHPSHANIPRLARPGLSCWWWAKGCSCSCPGGHFSFQGFRSGPTATAPNPGLALARPQWWQRWEATAPSPATGSWTSSGFPAFGWFQSISGATQVHRFHSSIITYKLVNRRKNIQTNLE